ncbi:PIG-L family deacetylase [candidate division KSB1 bacterium]|nr:PIG-L family deacetylase [candidate division KSB1 bacterium]
MKIWQKYVYPFVAVLFCMIIFTPSSSSSQEPKDPLRIIVFGAHPDDCELKAGGMAAQWASQGHLVKFVSTTNGDIGHATMAGGELAKRRTAEVEKAANILGITTQVLDIHDGELMPTLENRKTLVRLIREWKADIVIGHRPNDYHPDHRYTGILMQDAAFMVTVKFYCPDVPHLTQNPVFLYMSDRFQKPAPFEPDIVVSIDKVFDQKMQALWTLESQIESLWATGNFEKIIPVPTDPEKRQKRYDDLYDRIARRDGSIADQYRKKLTEVYGQENAQNIKLAEAFELCEYGRQPSKEDLFALFLIKESL